MQGTTSTSSLRQKPDWLVMDEIPIHDEEKPPAPPQEEPDPPRPNCYQRTCNHWSLYPMGAGIGVSIGGIVYSSVKDNILFVVLESIALVGLTLGYCYVRKFKPEKKMEERVVEVIQQMNHYRAENAQLQQSIEKVGKEREKMSANLQNAEELKKKMKKELDSKIQKINELQIKLVAAEKKLQAIEAVTLNLKGATEKITQGVSKFNEEHKELGETVAKFSDEFKGIEIHREKINVEVNAFDQENAEFLQQLQELVTQVDELEEQMKKMALHTEAVKKERELIGEKVGKLDEIDDKILESSRRYEEINKEFQEVQGRYQDVLKKLDVLGELDALMPQLIELLKQKK